MRMDRQATPENMHRLADELLGADEEHLTFEQMAAIADGASGDGIEHARRCITCSRELNDLRKFTASRTPPRRWLLPVAAALLIAIAGGSIAVTQIHESRLAEVAFPADVLAMRSRALSFRGTATRPEFDVVEPRNSIVMMDRPTFRWSAPAGAQSVVEVFGSNFERVAMSQPLSEHSWTPPLAFRRGVPYRWQVTFGSTTIPAPPQPEALFIVVPESSARAVAELQRSAQRPSLELASAYAQAGDFDAARAELHSLLNSGESTRAAQRLLARIDSVAR